MSDDSGAAARVKPHPANSLRSRTKARASLVERGAGFLVVWPLAAVGAWLYLVAVYSSGSGAGTAVTTVARGGLAAIGAFSVSVALALLWWALTLRRPRRWLSVGAPLLILAIGLGAALAPSLMPWWSLP